MTSPFIFDVSEYLRASALTDTVTATGPCPQRIGIPMIAIGENNPVTVTATITPLGEGVLVDADIDAQLDVQCARCLNELHPHQRLHISEVFSADDSLISGDAVDDDDDEGVFAVEANGTIDLSQAVIDAAGLSFPFSPVCELYGHACGEDDNDTPAPDGLSGQDEHTLVDPRWAGLEKFK